MSTSYVGKIVFLERAEPGKEYGSYGDGEFLVVRQTPNNLYVVSLKAGYDSSKIKQYPLVGKGKYNVASVEDFDESNGFISQMEDFIKQKDTPKRQWIESVYNDAADVLRQVKKVLNISENMENRTDELVGKLVFVERANPTKEHGTYQDGEYVVVRKTPNNIYGIKTNGSSLGWFDETALPLVGNNKYNVITVSEDREAVLELANKAESFANTGGNWSKAVYDNARSMAVKLRKIVGTAPTTTNVTSTVSSSNLKGYQLGELLAEVLRRTSSKVNIFKESGTAARVNIDISLPYTDARKLL